MAEADPDEVFETLRDLGLPEEAVRRAVARGRPEDAIFDSVLLPEIAERTVSANDVVARGGPALEQIEGFWEAFGLPIDDPDEPRFSEEEAEIFLRLHEMQDVWPPEVGLQVARVYGRLLARIAQTEIQVFREYVQPRLRTGDDPVAAMLATRDAFAQLLPTTGPLLLGVHRRWVGTTSRRSSSGSRRGRRAGCRGPCASRSSSATSRTSRPSPTSAATGRRSRRSTASLT